MKSESGRDEFNLRLRPARLRRTGDGPSALRLRQLRAAIRGGRRASRTAIRRSPRLAVAPSALQRSVVKVRYAANRGAGHWRAHGR